MSRTNFELADVGEDGNIPKNICFSFVANGKKQQTWHRLTDGIRVHSGDPWTLVHEILPTKVVTTEFGEGWGLVVFTKR